MKKPIARLSQLAVLALLLALALTAGASAFISAGDGGWFAQGEQPRISLDGVYTSDATHAWVVGESGTILATTDGGATWSKQSSGTTEWLLSVAFVDSTHGWAVGFGGTILATTDGGATWRAQSPGSCGDL